MFFPRLSSLKRKKIYVFWEDVSGYFSSHQWKGGGIDGRVSPRTGSSDRIVLAHCVGHVSRFLVWEYLFLLVLLRDDLGGLWMVFLWGPCRGGTGLGKRKHQDTYSRVVSLDDTRFQTSPFFMLYVIYWAHTCVTRSSRIEGAGDPRWSFDNLTVSSRHWRQWKDCCTSFLHGLYFI